MSLSVRRRATGRGSAPALVFDDRTLTWDELAGACETPARRDRPVVLVARRTPEVVLAILGAIEAGVPVALLHSRATAPELRSMRALVEGLPGNRQEDARGDATLAYVFTSGTTGAPRVAVLSRRAFIASARASHGNLPYGLGDRWLLAMPLSHVGGLSVLTRTLLGRATVVIVPEGPISARDLVARMEAGAVTHASLVPAMLRRILEVGLGPPAHLRGLLIGGARAPAAILEAASRAGWPVLPTYGSTETCAQVATRRLGDLVHQDGRIGPPLPGVDLRIVDGEVQVRGPMLFDGYLSPQRDGAEGQGLDRSAFDADGYYRTGDLGAVDADGALCIHGRRSELIITGGENVQPAGVEAALCAHPGVVEAWAYGLPDDAWGEIVAAVYRGVTGPVPELSAWLAERLAPHRRPKRLTELRDFGELPLTSSQKVDRRALRRLDLAARDREREVAERKP